MSALEAVAEFRVGFPPGLAGDAICGLVVIGFAVFSPLWVPCALVGWVVRRIAARATP